MTLSPTHPYQPTKLEPTPIKGKYHFTGYGTDYVLINNCRHEGSLIVLPYHMMAWPVNHFDTLEAKHFTMLAAFQPDVVIFGSGATLRFVKPHLTHEITKRGIAIETMDTPSACRTFNILANETRHVLVALLHLVA